MTIKLNVECVQGTYLREECVCVIAMDDSASLLDLHEMIQDAVSLGRRPPYRRPDSTPHGPRAACSSFCTP